MDKGVAVIAAIAAIAGIGGAIYLYESSQNNATGSNGSNVGMATQPISVPMMPVSNNVTTTSQSTTQNTSNANSVTTVPNTASNSYSSNIVTLSDTGGNPIVASYQGNQITVATGGNTSYASGGGNVPLTLSNQGAYSNVNYNGGSGGSNLMQIGTVLTSSKTLSDGTVVPAGATFIGNGGYELNGNYWY